jgi:hypothetical protein
MDAARKMDLADRYLNTKATRCDEITAYIVFRQCGLLTAGTFFS